MQIKIADDKIISIQKGETLYKSIRRQKDIYLTSSCGGKGICGKCKVKIIQGDFETKKYIGLTDKEKLSNIVLACQSIAKSDLTIEIPHRSKISIDSIALSKIDIILDYLKTIESDINPLVKSINLDLPTPSLSDNISDLERLKKSLSDRGIKKIRFPHNFVCSIGKVLRDAGWQAKLLYIEEGKTVPEAVRILDIENKRQSLGIAVDIGTTTIVVYLVDLITGKVIDIGSTYNSQILYGDDVISRIVYISEDLTQEKNLQELRNVSILDINMIINSLAEKNNIDPLNIETAVIAANTTMSHIFWGINPDSIRREPYIPMISYFPLWSGRTSGLNIYSQAPIYTMPCIASYIGGDIVAGVMASKMYKQKDIALFIDIGTNGEIVIGNNEWLITAACSAGPCFEGSGIKCGMKAMTGAIFSVKIDAQNKEPLVRTIGDVSSLGICGSGMIEAISEMFLKGVTDNKGILIEGRTQRIRRGEDGLEYVLTSKGDTYKEIVLTQPDIENIIRAKAAIYAGICTLLKKTGILISDIKKIYIAGGFGNSCDIQKVITIGMLPDLPLDRFEFLGNTAITGAYISLLSRELRRDVLDITSQMTYIDFSTSNDFMDEYVSALFLPHTDIKRFPSVTKI